MSGEDLRVADGSFVKAAMDDCILVIRADKTNQALLFDRVERALGLLNKHARLLGLNFANDKAQLLLPRDWVPPTERLAVGVQVRSNTLEDVYSQGIEVVGCPIGSLAFQSTFVERTLAGFLDSREDLKQLHPQCALRLLLQCVSACPAYISQVVQPQATLEYLKSFDDGLWSFFLELLGGVGGDQLECCGSLEGSF